MKPIYIKINEAKETPYARKLRIAETENGRKLRCRVVETKKKYKRSREIPDFNFLCTKSLASVSKMCYISLQTRKEGHTYMQKFWIDRLAAVPDMRNYDKEGSGVCR